MAELPVLFGLDGKALATLTTWFGEESRPVLDILPLTGYRDNKVVDWLLTPIDELLLSDGYAVLDMLQNMTPMSDNPKWLDYLGILLGYVGYGFWDYGWSVKVKQQLLAYSLLIWERLGTLWSLETVLRILEIPYHSVWQGLGAFLAAGEQGDPLNPNPDWTLAGVVAATQLDTAGTTLGYGQPYTAYLRMNSTLMRWDTRWLLANQVVRFFSPAVCETTVVYEYFLADLSVAGDPVF